MNESQERLFGTIEHVTYHNSDNGYAVLQVKVEGRKELITVVGYHGPLTAGEMVEALGYWKVHRQFGLQYEAKHLNVIRPCTLEGIGKFLSSGLIKGVGSHIAKQLIDAFGLKVFEVIEKRPEALLDLPGIGRSRVEMISKAWNELRAIRDIVVFLQSHGVTVTKAVRIYRQYGAQAIGKVRENPYQLARDIQGIGFKSADSIAMNLGVTKDSTLRARAAIQHVLMEHVNEGHVAFPEEEVIREATALLEIDKSILEEAVRLELSDHFLVGQKLKEVFCLYPAWLHRAECEVARRLSLLKHGSAPWGKISDEKTLEWAEDRLGLALAPLQKEAVRRALCSKTLVITGGPGTGKTTLTRAIVSILRKEKVKIVLCSPTGRAAKRLSECTGMEACTIHRMLGYQGRGGRFEHDESNPLSCDLLIMDESSMVDIPLMKNMLRALPIGAALFLVGDADQIPSVGPGCVLRAVIDSATIPVIRLTEIFRQAGESRIISNAHRINRGLMPEFPSDEKDGDFYFIRSEDPHRTVKTILELVKSRIPRRFLLDPVNEIQVLSPMNRGSLGTQVLNREIQKALNPESCQKVERLGCTFSVRDKVMVTVNDYDKEVFNGDIGFIRKVDSETEEVTIDFDGRNIVFAFSELDVLSLAYAISIHKSQGSEYPAVVIPIAMQHHLMLKRNLIYTGVTRGKKLVVVIGEQRALAKAVRSESENERWNNLAARLRKEFNG